MVEIEEPVLLDWLMECSDPSELRGARFRRALGREWVDIEEASRRIREARGEVIGARAGALLASLAGLPVVILFHGATPFQVLFLALGLAAAGSAALIRRGPEVLGRVLVSQSLAAIVLGAGAYGLKGVVAAVYLPWMSIALLTLAGARVGRSIGRARHSRDVQRLLALSAVHGAERAEDAVAA